MGAVLREQNALPHDGWKTISLLAKPDVDNVGAGRAAKGASPVISGKRQAPVIRITNSNSIGLDGKSRLIFL